MNRRRLDWRLTCLVCLTLSIGCGSETTPDASVEADGSVSTLDGGPEDLDTGLMNSDGGAISEDASITTDTATPRPQDMAVPRSQDKSYKRGIAFGFESPRDLQAISEGTSWWYNWSPSYNQAVADLYVDYGMDWVPMTWNGNNPDQVRAFLEMHPNVRYLLGFNEPNFSDQANLTPAYAASLWPTFEAIAEEFDVKLVGPAVNYCGGCVVVDGEPLGNDYIIWLDLFFEEFRAQFGREPKMDYLALHWYDFGLQDQVERIVSRYGKPIWVTEFALWRGEDWNTDEFERNWLLEAVQFLEEHPMVYRYAWFTGRRGDFPKIDLLGADGELTPLGQAYVEAPF